MQYDRSYWHYFLRSKGRHGIHSPFVFQLVDACLTTKVDKNFQNKRKKWFAELHRNRHEFPFTDLGAGSKRLEKKRSVSSLAKLSSSRGIYGSVLWQLAHFYRPSAILELGTSIGIGTVHLKQGAPQAHIVTVEGCDQTLSRASQSFDYWNLDGITTICSSFDAFLKLPSFLTYDLIFVDGHHDGEAMLKYLERLLDQSHNETLFIFDDIRWSDDMWRAWQTIVSDTRLHVTIDLGRMGLVWRRKQQTKEHFVVRPKIIKARLF